MANFKIEVLFLVYIFFIITSLLSRLIELMQSAYSDILKILITSFAFILKTTI